MARAFAESFFDQHREAMKTGKPVKGVSYDQLLCEWGIKRYADVWPHSQRHPVLPPQEHPIHQREWRYSGTQPATGGSWHGDYDYYRDAATLKEHKARQEPGYICRVGSQWKLFLPQQSPDEIATFMRMMVCALESHPFIDEIQPWAEERTEHYDEHRDEHPQHYAEGHVAFYCKKNFSGIVGYPYPHGRLAQGVRIPSHSGEVVLRGLSGAVSREVGVGVGGGGASIATHTL